MAKGNFKEKEKEDKEVEGSSSGGRKVVVVFPHDTSQTGGGKGKHFHSAPKASFVTGGRKAAAADYEGADDGRLVSRTQEPTTQFSLPAKRLLNE